MSGFATALKFAFVAIVAASTLSPDAFAAKRRPETQAEIDCWNRATNDYFDQIKECERALSDLPNDLVRCKDDARDDRDREHNRCVKAARASKGGAYGVGGKPPAAKAP